MKYLLTLIVSTMFLVSCFGGIRWAEDYCGIVVFDRWDACILYSSVYLMYVSKDVKDSLREYSGQSVKLDAQKVVQPHNPGDGRIEKLAYLGPAPFNPKRDANVEGIEIMTRLTSQEGETPILTIILTNTSTSSITIQTDELAPTLLARKPKRYWGPSDESSYAAMTRSSFWFSDSSVTSCHRGDYSWSMSTENALPRTFILQGGECKRIQLSFQLPYGEYQFLCGYGGHVHESKSIASNLTSFDVDHGGMANIVEMSKR